MWGRQLGFWWYVGNLVRARIFLTLSCPRKFFSLDFICASMIFFLRITCFSLLIERVWIFSAVFVCLNSWWLNYSCGIYFAKLPPPPFKKSNGPPPLSKSLYLFAYQVPAVHIEPIIFTLGLELGISIDEQRKWKTRCWGCFIRGIYLVYPG